MARKLKTYVTSAGFYDLAVAAPSMKAALQAWGSRSDLFQHGFAKVSEDPAIVAATMARPGVVLRRPVGSNDAFGERADLPRHLPKEPAVAEAGRTPEKGRAKTKQPPREAADPKAADLKAALARTLTFEREQERRELERRRKEAIREKERQRRERAIAAAEAALEEARRDHQAKVAEIERDRAALDRRSEAEDSHWRKKKERLEAALRQARS